jgi:threonine/homoserine/homoserine lactone efflux protein
MNILCNGIIIGFCLAAPVGPIGLLCIRKTLMFGWSAGFVSGLGAACADGLYGCIASCGLAVVSQFLIAHAGALKLIGGIFLCYLGIKTIIGCTKHRLSDSEKTEKRAYVFLVGDFISVFFLTLTNPLTILSFIAIFGGMGVVSMAHDYIQAVMLACGVFIGSALWWLVLSSATALLRSKMTDRYLQLVDILCGLVLVCYGVWAFYLWAF